MPILVSARRVPAQRCDFWCFRIVERQGANPCVVYWQEAWVYL
jgi:hypothetical protein